MSKQNVIKVVIPTLVLIAVIVLWYLVSLVILPPRRRFILPPPDHVIEVAFLNPDHLRELMGAIWVSARIAIFGLLLAAIIGVSLAILMSQAKWVEFAVYPYAVALQSVPILAIVPLIAFALGYGFGSRVLVVILVSIFPIITNTLFGLHSTSRALEDLFTLNKANSWRRLVQLRLPASMPALFTGLRISAGMAVVGSIVADYFFRRGEAGIGLQIDTYRNQLNGEMLYGAIILASLLGLVTFWIFGLLAKIVVGGWYQPNK